MLKMDQTLAMHDLADITETEKHMTLCFAVVPIYHGKDDEDFDEWGRSIRSLM